MSNTWQAKKVEIKVYLEGVEFPVTSVQLMEQVGAIPRCSIQVPIGEKVLDLDPNTLVHVFYKDTHSIDWILIFEGEYVGHNLSKSDRSRTVNLECVALTHHWDQAIKGGLTEVFSQNVINYKVNMIFQDKKSDQSASINSTNKTDVDEFQQFLKDINLSDISLGLQEDNSMVGNGADFEVLFNSFATQTVSFSALINSLVESFKSGSTDYVVRNFIRGLSDVFARASAGYTMFHIVYKLANRIFDFSNDKSFGILTTSSAKDYIQNITDSVPNNSNFTNFLKKTLASLNYESVYLTAPTVDQSSGAPMSTILTPSVRLFSPIACNTIFKDEVTTAGYSRNILNEPTRYAGYTYPSNAVSTFAGSIVVSPSTELHYDPTQMRAMDLMLTRKERMSGVRGSVAPNDFDEFKSFRDAGGNDNTDDDTNNLLTPLRERYVDMEYNSMVLGSRGFTLNTVYSPYRICGFPGLYVDDKLSSISGIIGSITSTISSDGTSVSSISFRYPSSILPNKNVNNRNMDLDYWLKKSGIDAETINDPEKLKKRWPFKKNQKVVLSTGDTVTLDGGDIKSGNNAVAWVDYLKYRLDHKDDIPFLPTWYDADKYFVDNIGSNMYRTMMYGIYDSGTSPNIDNGIKQTYFSANNPTLDGSIGRYRDDSMQFGTGLNTNMENTNYMGHFLSKLIENYNGATDRHKFIDKFTRRNVITEREYWNFFVGQNSPVALESVKKPNSFEGDYYGAGIRSISDSLGEERSLVKQLKELSEDGITSAPFIKERREVVQRVVNSLKTKNNYYIGD